MSQKEYSVFDKATGLFTGTIISVPDDRLEQNTPAGHSVVEGRHDHLSRRVDLEAVTDGLIGPHHVVDWQPPPPSENHEWNAKTRRWHLTATAAALADADLSSRAALADIDRRSIRRLRELFADSDPRLGALEAEAISARFRLTKA